MSCQYEINDIDMDIFARIIDSADWIDNTIYVKKEKKDVVDDNKILSRVAYLSNLQVNELQLGQAIGDKLRMIDDRMIGSEMTFHNTRLVHYGEKGFMKEHTDIQQKKYHVGRLAFIPPSTNPRFDFVGGLLRVKERYFPQENKWQVVYIPYGYPHEVLEVLNGDRYVIVADMAVNGIDEFTYSKPEYCSDEYSSEECDVGYGLYD
jgi:hypothetical protein